MTTWKTDENGNIQLKDGNPVYVDSNGTEKVMMADTITRLGNEAKTHRTAKEEALEKLKLFEGLDAAKAREALETVSKLDQKQLIESGKVDELKSQITQQFQSQLSEKETAFNELKSKYENTLINNVFANSDFIRDNLAVPRDMFEATFRNNFKVENGEITVYDKAGNRLLSPKRGGEYATPEEAFEILVDAHPQKDVILKANAGSGSGNNGGGGNGGATRTIRRSDQENYHPVQWAEMMKKAARGEAKLVD